jgi:hypothetical protein
MQVFSDLFILIICASNAIIYSILGEKFRAVRVRYLPRKTIQPESCSLSS